MKRKRCEIVGEPKRLNNNVLPTTESVMKYFLHLSDTSKSKSNADIVKIITKTYLKSTREHPFQLSHMQLRQRR